MEGADLQVPGGLVSMAFGVFVQRLHGAWPTAVRKSVFGSICAATGAPKEHFGCQKATKKCKRCGFLEKLAKLIWIGEYHTILMGRSSQKSSKNRFKMCFKAATLTSAVFDHKCASEGRSGAPLGDFCCPTWAPLGHPPERNS